MAIPLNEGARQIALAGSAAKVAEKIGVAARTVSSWRSGRVVPEHASRQRIRDAVGVPIDAWDQLPQLADVREPAQPEQDGAQAAQEPQERAIEQLRAQLQRIRATRAGGGLTQRAACDLERVELACLRELHRAEGGKLTMAQVMSSPHLATIVEALLDALEGHPLAMFDVSETVFRLAERADPGREAREFRAAHQAACAAVEAANAALATELAAARGAQRPI